MEIRYRVKVAAKRGQWIYVASVTENNQGKIVKFRRALTKEEAHPFAKFHAEDIAARLKACRYFPEIEAVNIA